MDSSNSASGRTAGAADGRAYDLRLSVFVNQPVFYDGSAYTTDFRQTTDLILSLAETFREVRLCVPLRRSGVERGAVEMPLPPGATVVGLPYYYGERGMVRNLPRIAYESRRLLRREARTADIVGYVSPSVIGLIYGRAAGGKPQFELIRGDKARTVAEIHRVSPMGALYRGGAWLLTRMAARHRRRVRPVTFAYGRKLKARIEAENPGRVCQISDGLPPWLAEMPPARVRATPGPDEPLRLLSVGRLSREKGLDVLLDAVADLHRSGMRLRLTIVGAGGGEGALRARIASLGLSDCVRMAGWLPPGPELGAEYDAADAFALPSRTEGVPRSVQEAMARGMAVVAADVGGVPDLVEDGATGLLTPPDDRDALAAALRRLREVPELMPALSRNALREAPRHTIEAQRRRMVAALRSAYPALFASFPG